VKLPKKQPFPFWKQLKMKAAETDKLALFNKEIKILNTTKKQWL